MSGTPSLSSHKIRRPPGPVLALLGLIVGVEVLLSVTDLRGFFFAAFAFAPNVMEAARPLYPGHGLVMFVSHVFVHIGPLHMLSNVLILYLLWYLMPWMYLSDYLMVFAGGALGGALCFSVLSPPGATMTGASGAAAGLAMVWGMYEMFLIHRGHVLSLRPKRTAVLVGLVAIGALLNADQHLSTAWQTHLGGALAGAAFGTGLILRAIVEKYVGPTDPRELDGDAGHNRPGKRKG